MCLSLQKQVCIIVSNALCSQTEEERRRIDRAQSQRRMVAWLLIGGRQHDAAHWDMQDIGGDKCFGEWCHVTLREMKRYLHAWFGGTQYPCKGYENVAPGD